MTLRTLMSVWFWTLNTDWIGCVGVCSSSVHSAVKPLITRSVAATGSLIVPQLVMFMCIRVSVCVQIDWPVIRRLNGVCCPSALLIKLDWSGLVGTCHNQPKPHPSPADLATAWALGHCRGPPGPEGSFAQELTTTITPWIWSQDDPKRGPFSFLTPAPTPRPDPPKWPLSLPQKSWINEAFRGRSELRGRLQNADQDSQGSSLTPANPAGSKC